MPNHSLKKFLGGTALNLLAPKAALLDMRGIDMPTVGCLLLASAGNKGFPPKRFVINEVPSHVMQANRLVAALQRRISIHRRTCVLPGRCRLLPQD